MLLDAVADIGLVVTTTMCGLPVTHSTPGAAETLPTTILGS